MQRSANGSGDGACVCFSRLRTALAPRYASLPDHRLEQLVASRLGADAEGIESVMSALGSLGRVVERSLPGALAGAATGAALGPMGALAGATAGALGAFGSGGQPARSAAAPGAAAGGPAPLAAGAANPGAQLLASLGRPEVQQALLAMALGSLGRNEIAVGTKAVPLGAFANLFQVLGSQVGQALNAAARPATESEEVPAYLLDELGEFRGDPSDPEHRAAALWELIESESESFDDEEADDYTSEDYDDLLDLARLGARTAP